MDEWIEAVRAELGVSTDVPTEALLDVARIAAHAIARPAAPITTFLLGAAVAQGADPEDALRRITALAESWENGG